jgi:glycosyltransferase involved in cell wall biosynthesis
MTMDGKPESNVRVHVLSAFGSSEWPSMQVLRSRWPNATFDFGGLTPGGYKTRWDVLWKNFQLFAFGFRAALKARRHGRDVQAVLTFSDTELLGFACAGFCAGFRPPIVLQGFIYTRRSSPMLNLIRRAYFRVILSCARGVICHSNLEKSTYTELFQLSETRFFSVPYGTHVNGPADLWIGDGGYAFSAGRSGRDYALLARVFERVELPLRIACDSDFALKDIRFPENVSVLRNCHGDDYLRELAGAQFVVIPIKDDGVSSGQMVLINAMAFGKATIITRTNTTSEYGEHGDALMFVERGSERDLREAVTRLANDKALRAQLGKNASHQFATRYSITSVAHNTAAAVEAVVALCEDEPGK